MPSNIQYSNGDTKYDSGLCLNNKWVWETQTFTPISYNTSHSHIIFSNHPNVVQVLLKICYQYRKCLYPCPRECWRTTTRHGPAGCAGDSEETVTEGSTYYLRRNQSYRHCYSGTGERNETIYFLLQAYGSIELWCATTDCKADPKAGHISSGCWG